MVGVRVGVAVLVADGRRGEVTAHDGPGLRPAGPGAAAAAAGSAREQGVVGDVRRVAQAGFLAVV